MRVVYFGIGVIMHGCLVEILMVDGKGQSDDSLVSENTKDMLKVVKYCGVKLF